MKNRSEIFLVILILLICANTFAQEVEKDTVSFERNRSFDFYFLNSFAIGYKFNLSENSSLKFIADLNGSYLNKSSALEDGDIETKERRDNINLNLYCLYYYSIFRNNYVEISLGAGPYINPNLFLRKTIETNVRIYRNYSSSCYLGLGVVAVFGVEGFITSHVSLIAETYLTGSYRFEKQYYEVTQNAQGVEIYRSVYTWATNGWVGEINFVRLGIGIYF